MISTSALLSDMPVNVSRGLLARVRSSTQCWLAKVERGLKPATTLPIRMTRINHEKCALNMNSSLRLLFHRNPSREVDSIQQRRIIESGPIFVGRFAATAPIAVIVDDHDAVWRN